MFELKNFTEQTVIASTGESMDGWAYEIHSPNGDKITGWRRGSELQVRTYINKNLKRLNVNYKGIATWKTTAVRKREVING